MMLILIMQLQFVADVFMSFRNCSKAIIFVKLKEKTSSNVPSLTKTTLLFKSTNQLSDNIFSDKIDDPVLHGNKYIFDFCFYLFH